MRIAAIQYRNDAAKDNVLKLMKDVQTFHSFDSIVLFKSSGIPAFDEKDCEGLEYSYVDIPEDVDSSPKQKNYILSWAEQQKFNGFLHIIEDNVVIDKDPTTYVNNLENAMHVLDYSIHFSTITDPCNYVFKKFQPRLTINMDDPDIQKKLHLPNSLFFTSHSNTAWITYDFSSGHAAMKYDENFTIGMFYIIEYLARRKATKKNNQLYFMNQYLGISDEVGVFHTIEIKDNKFDPNKMKEEDELFKSMNIDYAPDNNIDVILDSLYAKIKEKML